MAARRRCGSCKCKKLSAACPWRTRRRAQRGGRSAAGADLLCVPQSNVVLESPRSRKKAPTGAQDAGAREPAEKKSADVMLIKLQLPANDSFAFHAGQYVEFLLRDGARRSYSMASAPHTLAAAKEARAGWPAIELHIRHMPGGKFTTSVRRMKERNPAHRRPYGSFSCVKTRPSPSCCWLGHRLRADQGILSTCNTKASPGRWRCMGRPRRPISTARLGGAKGERDAQPAVRAVVSDALPQDHWHGRTGFVHQAVLQDLPDLRATGLCLRCPIVVDSARRDYTAQADLPEEEFFADAFTSEADKHGA